MSLLEFFKRYWLVLVLSFTAIGMGVIKWSYGSRVLQENEIVLPEPTVIPTESETEVKEKAEKFDRDYPLFDQLPYKGSNYVIEQYEEPLTLNIAIDKGADKAKVLKEIDAWMFKNKIATDSHKLVIQ